MLHTGTVAAVPSALDRKPHNSVFPHLFLVPRVATPPLQTRLQLLENDVVDVENDVGKEKGDRVIY